MPIADARTKRKKGKRNLVFGPAKFTKKTQKKYELKAHIEKQWGLKDIEIEKVWAQTKGKKNVVVAVIDTGIYPQHPCLKNNLWVNKKEIPNNGKDDDKNGFIDDVHGWNFADNNADIRDRHGHGTHISGIIAASGKTNSSPHCRVAGVAPNVSIMTLAYYDSKNNRNNVANTIKAVDYAVQNGADIINYSGGGPGPNHDERASIARAADKGVIFISAAGNESSEISSHSKYYPASYNLPNIISLNSKDNNHSILDSSNWVKIDWKDRDKIHNQTAPGKNIVSTLPPRHYIQGGLMGKLWRSLAFAPHINSDEIYGYMTGTSQATAVMSGVVALIKSQYPKWTTAQIIRQVNNTGYGKLGDRIKEKTNQGKSLNAYEALNMRDRNIDFDDSPSTGSSNIIMPTTSSSSDLKNLVKKQGMTDVHDPSHPSEKPFDILQKIRSSLNNKKK